MLKSLRRLGAASALAAASPAAVVVVQCFMAISASNREQSDIISTYQDDIDG